ncbi:MAG TPA: hypothetical protein PLJ44_10260, partial [Victivallales bacterium]|nr:hypothetical protein [Victivallales bacterium]
MKNINKIIKLNLLIIIGICLLSSLSYANDFADRLKSNTRIFSEISSRITGSEGCKEAAKIIKNNLCEIRNIKVISQYFEVETPLYYNSYIETNINGKIKQFPIYPLWPELVRLNTTPKNGINGKPVYCGKASMTELPGKALQSQIAVMEMADYQNWRNPFMMGASALLLLASNNEEIELPGEQAIYKPRFYVKDTELCNALRTNKISSLKIYSDGKWKSSLGENIYAIIKGTDDKLQPIVIFTGYDSMSIVPQLAPGADTAIDTSFLLLMVKFFSTFQPKRSVVFVFTDAMYLNNLGTRLIFSMLSSDKNDNTRQSYIKMEEKILEEYQKIAELIDSADNQELLTKLPDKSKFREIQRYCKDELSPEIMRLREKNGILRLKINQNPDNKRELEDEIRKNTERLEFLNRTLFRILNGKKNYIKNSNNENYENETELYADKVIENVKKRILKQKELQEKRIEFFHANDKIREEIINYISPYNKTQNPFTFVIAINLSDSGRLIAPSLYCHQNRSNDKDIAEDFIRWLKITLSENNDLTQKITKDKIDFLRIKEFSEENFLNKILTLDNISQVEAEIYKEFITTFPQIDKYKLKELSIEISSLKTTDYNDLKRIIQKAIPDLNEKILQKLVNNILNISAIEGREIPESFSQQPIFLPTSAARSFRLKGLTWATMEGTYEKIDTPKDTFDAISWEKIIPQAIATVIIMDLFLNDNSFSTSPLNISGMPRWRIPHGTIVSDSVAETIARTPMPDFLTVLSSNNNWASLNNVRGFRGHEFVRTQIDGSFRFYPCPSPHLWWVDDRRKVQAFKLNELGQIIQGLSDSTSILSGNMASVISLRSSPPLNPIRRLAFDCIELNGPQFFDPRYQTLLSNYSFIDPVRGGPHKRAHFSIFRGQSFGLLPPESAWQLIISSGLQKNRMILMNVSEKIEEENSSLIDCIKDGFPATTQIPALPELQSASDMFLIDSWRLRRLENAGISFPVIKQIHEHSAKLIEHAKKSYESDNGTETINFSREALANELRAYHAIQSQSDDVTRGVIFLLILLVPFSISMERLLFARVKIEQQIIFSIAIFAIMLAILWSFHPGFKISSQPLIILIAFLILLLSMTVIIIVMNKFKYTLDEFRKGSNVESLRAESSKSAVISSAIWLGIANMRKRLLRTLLTATSIVIITFALLCFTSSSTYNDKKIYNLSLNPSDFTTGIYIQHPALRQMAKETEDNIKLFLENKYPVSGRYWLTSTNPSWRLIVRNSQNSRAISLKAALFLSKEERFILNPQNFLEQWESFEKTNGCYISKKNAEALELKVGDIISVAGFDFKILDIYDSKVLDTKLKKLDGQSLLPLDYSIETDNWAMSQEALEGQISTTGDLEKDQKMNFCSSDDIIILPASFSKKMNAQLRGIAVAIPPEEARKCAEKIMQIIVYPVYYNDGKNIRAIVSTPLIPKVPTKIFIPILIASLIIFNTILNSVAERKGEIHIYTSIGLAPHHVGILFLAEALTYGMMGAVFGYIVGQGLAKFLN